MRINAENFMASANNKLRAWLAGELVRNLREMFDRLDAGDDAATLEFRHLFCFDSDATAFSKATLAESKHGVAASPVDGQEPAAWMFELSAGEYAFCHQKHAHANRAMLTELNHAVPLYARSFRASHVLARRVPANAFADRVVARYRSADPRAEETVDLNLLGMAIRQTADAMTDAFEQPLPADIDRFQRQITIMAEESTSLLKQRDTLRTKLALAAEELERLLENIIEPPDRNCSCHISPPCSDCTDWSGLRDAIAQAKEALATANEPAGGLYYDEAGTLRNADGSRSIFDDLDACESCGKTPAQRAAQESPVPCPHCNEAAEGEQK